MSKGKLKYRQCRVCGRKVMKDEEFVLVGKYPSQLKTLYWRYAGPEVYGDMYHKSCFLETIKNEKKDPQQAKPKNPNMNPDAL